MSQDSNLLIFNEKKVLCQPQASSETFGSLSAQQEGFLEEPNEDQSRQVRGYNRNHHHRSQVLLSLFKKVHLLCWLRER